jgi:hypothetical protein
MIIFHESAMTSQADMPWDRLAGKLAGKPYPYIPCEWASPERVLRLFQLAHRQVIYPFGHPMPYAYAIQHDKAILYRVINLKCTNIKLYYS